MVFNDDNYEVQSYDEDEGVKETDGDDFNDHVTDDNVAHNDDSDDCNGQDSDQNNDEDVYNDDDDGHVLYTVDFDDNHEDDGATSKMMTKVNLKRIVILISMMALTVMTTRMRRQMMTMMVMTGSMKMKRMTTTMRMVIVTVMMIGVLMLMMIVSKMMKLISRLKRIASMMTLIMMVMILMLATGKTWNTAIRLSGKIFCGASCKPFTHQLLKIHLFNVVVFAVNYDVSPLTDHNENSCQIRSFIWTE